MSLLSIPPSAAFLETIREAMKKESLPLFKVGSFANIPVYADPNVPDGEIQVRHGDGRCDVYRWNNKGDG